MRLLKFLVTLMFMIFGGNIHMNLLKQLASPKFYMNSVSECKAPREIICIKIKWKVSVRLNPSLATLSSGAMNLKISDSNVTLPISYL